MSGKNKITLITGASGGIGEHLAHQFAQGGDHVLLVARSEDKLVKLAEQIEKVHSVKAHHIALDLSDAAALDQLDQYLSENEMSVEHLVNNAGFGLNGPIGDLPREDQLNMIDLNVKTLADLSMRYLAQVKENKGGIMNVASTISFLSAPYMGVYGATKAFVLSFTEALAEENKDIKVCAVCPGPTATGFGERAQMDRSDLFDNVPTMTAEDVAKIAYVDYMRGKVISVTGISNKPLPFILRLAPRFLIRKIAGSLMNTEKSPLHGNGSEDKKED